MKQTVTAAAVAMATLISPAFADDIDTVRAFYSDILTDPAGTTADRYFELFSPDVVSIPTPPGGEGAQGMLNTVAFLGQVVPDLTWVPQEIIETGDIPGADGDSGGSAEAGSTNDEDADADSEAAADAADEDEEKTDE